MALIDDFKNELYQATENYAMHIQSKGYVISDGRAGDIGAIRAIIHSSSRNPVVIRDDLCAYFAKMKTGFWFVETGHSDLKNRLLAVMQKPGFKFDKFLNEAEQFGALEIMSDSAAISSGEASADAGCEEEKGIAWYRARIKGLEQNVRSLRKELRAKNAELADLKISIDEVVGENESMLSESTDDEVPRVRPRSPSKMGVFGARSFS